ncbi:hypothetical protein PsYK624_168120 [Phanerochaete sordida]|uniref:Uncharacterized protein n=1 Tax=Phanerochaete sordida TaxID=48140 RepID=A0A9P3GRH8_9APHY|nr:hypothetical protein PsYK624_168120 [Phanerochaete sordida]
MCRISLASSQTPYRSSSSMKTSLLPNTSPPFCLDVCHADNLPVLQWQSSCLSPCAAALSSDSTPSLRPPFHSSDLLWSPTLHACPRVLPRVPSAHRRRRVTANWPRHPRAHLTV